MSDNALLSCLLIETINFSTTKAILLFIYVLVHFVVPSPQILISLHFLLSCNFIQLSLLYLLASK